MSFRVARQPMAVLRFSRLTLNCGHLQFSFAYYDKNRTIEESSYSLDAVYTLQDGRAKGTMFKLHFTEYDNRSNIPSWGGGYGNIFQDERDVKFIVIAPFTIF